MKIKTQGIFITGTDTGVGKTFVGAGLVATLRERGIDVGVMKPAETGCVLRKGVLVPRDALKLMKAGGVDDPLDLVNPYRFRDPLAPASAAAHAGKTIGIKRIVSAFRMLARKHAYMVVEGAGGIMVPLTSNHQYLELAKVLNLPVLVVARPGLGTINHTLLTVMALRSFKLHIAGIVINHRSKKRPGLADRTGPPFIERLSGVPIVGHVSFRQKDLGAITRKLFTLK
jgi:dethiobiotin synthetase